MFTYENHVIILQMKHFVLDHRKDDTVSTYNLDSFRLKHNCFVQNITSGSFALCYVCWLFFFFPFVSVLFPLQTNLLWHKVRNCFDHKKTLHNDSVFPASAQVQTHTSSSFSQSWTHNFLHLPECKGNSIKPNPTLCNELWFLIVSGSHIRTRTFILLSQVVEIMETPFHLK